MVHNVFVISLSFPSHHFYCIPTVYFATDERLRQLLLRTFHNMHPLNSQAVNTEYIDHILLQNWVNLSEKTHSNLSNPEILNDLPMHIFSCSLQDYFETHHYISTKEKKCRKHFPIFKAMWYIQKVRAISAIEHFQGFKSWCYVLD